MATGLVMLVSLARTSWSRRDSHRRAKFFLVSGGDVWGSLHRPTSLRSVSMRERLRTTQVALESTSYYSERS